MALFAKHITNLDEWENFVLEQDMSLFMQSPAYVDFNQAEDSHAFVMGVFDDDELVGGSLVVEVRAKRGSYLYMPYGPLFGGNPEKVLKSLTDALSLYAKDNDFDFIKSSPFVESDAQHEKMYTDIGYRNAPLHQLAEHTWILDIAGDEDSLLAAMNKNHRNLIRRCEREGVTVEKITSYDEDKLNLLNFLIDETASRHSFTRFSSDFVNNEFKEFVERGEAVLFLSYLPDGKLDGGAIVIYYGNMAAYRHSGSLSLDKKLPTAYLIQWRAIQEAKRKGMRFYNFWGIAPSNASKKHPFYGITHFKKGFGGFEKVLVHCKDYPITYKYWINWLVEYYRKLRRGF